MSAELALAIQHKVQIFNHRPIGTLTSSLSGLKVRPVVKEQGFSFMQGHQ